MAGSKCALLVAANQYEDPKFQELRAPAQDVNALSRVLSAPDVGDFQVRVLLNKPSFVIAEEIEGFLADRKRDDFVLLYFSCHGIKDERGALYLAASNTRLNRLVATGLPSWQVTELLERSRSNRKSLLLDCCYSGAFTRGFAPRAGQTIDVADSFGGRGLMVITASNAMEYAFESGELTQEAAQPSVFTSALVEGLETGTADLDGDGHVSMDELYDFVYEKVREITPNQTPTKAAHGVQGDLYLARSPLGPQPAPLHPELREAIASLLVPQRLAAVSELQRLLVSDQPRLVLAAQQALQELTEDDSLRVRKAASEVLAVHRPIDQQDRTKAKEDFLRTAHGRQDKANRRSIPESRAQAELSEAQTVASPPSRKEEDASHHLAEEGTRRAATDQTTGERGGPPILDLSATEIDLRNVQPGTVLPEEHVAVTNRGGGRLEWSVKTDADWLEVQAREGGFGIRLHPRPGVNRGNVLVRDLVAGVTRTLPVHVEVVSSPPPRTLGRLPVSVGLVAVAAVMIVMVVSALVVVLNGEKTPTEVRVDGTTPWTDTGLDVSAGDHVEVSALGEVFHNEASSIGPEGFPNRPDLLTPLATANHAGLLGRVGPRGDPFYIGRSTTFVVKQNGRLFLGINDGGLENNRGFFTATIKVRRN
ncbi:MAG: caspase family protein [Actinomycetota bacterium]|nr:caspase family protein [Actinomycetota bacterium]